MPRVAGACWHFRPLMDGLGTTDLMCALVSMGEVDLEHGGKTVKVWLVQQIRLGGQVSGSYHLDEDGRVIHVDYGGAQVHRTTKEAALKDLHEGLKPQTAD